MAQHKMKKKVVLPKGAKQKSLKRQNNSQKSTKRGTNIVIAPKKQAAVRDAKVSGQVSTIINAKNEELVRMRADKSTGKTSK
jgi:hypothetical protein